MVYSLKKIQLAIIALVITVAGQVQGGNYTTSASWDRTGAPESCCPETCCSENCGQFFFEASLLYLRAYEGGLSSVCDSTDIINTSENGTVVSTLKGKSHDPDFNWNPGFRIAAAYEFADSNCGIGVDWTHYNSHTRGNNNHDNRHKWNLDYDVVDVVYGCECQCSNCCLVLIPYGGVKFASIDQKLHTHLVSTVTSDTVSTTSTSKGRLKEEFFGVGPLFGIDGEWAMGCGFSLYGDISVAFLYGTSHGRSHQTEVFDTGININHLRRHHQTCQTVVDAGFGVRWRTCLCDRILVLQLGLEQHRFFNFNRFCDNGDLSLDGVSLSAGIAF